MLRDPLCSLCEEETYQEEGAYVCQNCQCAWSVETANDYPPIAGEWFESEQEQCPATSINPWRPDLTWRCYLGVGHEGWHHGKPEDPDMPVNSWKPAPAESPAGTA